MSNSDGFTSMLNDVAAASHSSPHAPHMDPGAFDAVTESRRSVRVFTGAPIPEAVMTRLLDLAMLAPSSSNLQPWEFHWVRSEAKKAALIEACMSQPAAKTAGELVVVIARTGTWKRNVQEMLRVFETSGENVPSGVLQYYRKLVPLALTTGPVNLLAPFKWVATRLLRYKQPTPQEPIGFADVRVWAHKSVALAAQTLMLAARAHNLDSCPMEGFDSWRVAKLLNLPDDAEVSMVIGLGVRAAGGVYGPRLRFDRKLFVFEH